MENLEFKNTITKRKNNRWFLQQNGGDRGKNQRF